MSSLLTMENELLKTYLFYVSLLGMKMLAMSVLTGMKRHSLKAFANPEDAGPLKLKVKVDDNVERVRRAHLNDLENITVFFVVSFAYILTNPEIGRAKLLFRIATASRFLHTLVYAVVVIPQPARAVAFYGAYGVILYMGVQSIMHFAGYM